MHTRSTTLNGPLYNPTANGSHLIHAAPPTPTQWGGQGYSYNGGKGRKQLPVLPLFRALSYFILPAYTGGGNKA